MGGAILRGMLNGGFGSHQVSVVDPTVKQGEFAECKIYADISDLPTGYNPEAVMFAVKPQLIDKVIHGYTDFAKKGALFLSVIAGKNLNYFTAHLGEDVPVIRTMPNLPAAIGKGVTAACANHNVTQKQRDLSVALLSAIGQVVWVEDEGNMGAATALSGSGPAYVFYFLEMMAQTGCELGLPEEVAFELAKHTFAGSGEMMMNEKSAENVGVLRENVTSPGGTTAAALACFMDKEEGLRKIVQRAMKAARDRSDELSG